MTPGPRKPRWCLRTLALLALAAAFVITGNVPANTGRAELLLLTFPATVAAILGATCYSIRGISAGGWLPR